MKKSNHLHVKLALQKRQVLRLKQGCLMTWMGKLRERKTLQAQSQSADKWRKNRILRITFECLKIKAHTNAIVEQSTQHRALKTKSMVLNSWSVVAQKSVQTREQVRKLVDMRNSQNLQVHWNLLKAEFKNRVCLKEKLATRRKEIRRRWLMLWVQETNLSRSRVLNGSSIMMTHADRKLVD